MHSILRMTALVTIIAVVVYGPFSALAATEATIQGTVKIPCDPSRVSDVLSVQIRPVSGESATTVAVDSSTGKFRSSGLATGEYELIAIGIDGKPLSPEPTELLLTEGANAVVLSLQPPGCGEPDAGEKKPGKKNGLKDWHITVIYLGAVGAVALALDDDEEPASPF